METVVSGMVLFDDAPPLISEGSPNESLSPYTPWFLDLSDRAGPNSVNEHSIPNNVASAQQTSAFVLLDTSIWSDPSALFVAPYAPSGPHLSVVGSHDQLPLLDGCPKDFTEMPSPCQAPAFDITPMSQATLHTQQAPALILGTFDSLRHNHASAVNDLDHPTFPNNTVPVLSSSTGSSEDCTSLVNDKVQPPVAFDQLPGKKGSRRRRCRRACAISIEGLWIDSDDIYSAARQGSSKISVHECQWAKYSNPCGMWIIGSRSLVSAHIRKWHSQDHGGSTAKCQWSECTTSKAMLRGSVNRHVVTVHLEEGFHCHGCNQEFSRKDVYDKHVQMSELCRDADYMVVYGTERRVIDTHQVLWRDGQSCYAD